MRWYILAAAKARGKTLDEYLAGGWLREAHIHEEIAFDMLESMLNQVEDETPESVQGRTPGAPGADQEVHRTELGKPTGME